MSASPPSSHDTTVSENFLDEVNQFFEKNFHVKLSVTKIFVVTSILILYNGYLIFAAMFGFTSCPTWCEGIKLLLAITFFIYSMFFIGQICYLCRLNAVDDKIAHFMNRWASCRFIFFDNPNLFSLTVGFVITVIIILDAGTDRKRFTALAGLWILIFVAILISKYPYLIYLRPAMWGIVLQVMFAFFFRNSKSFISIILCIKHVVGYVERYTNNGTEFLFGYLATGKLSDGSTNSTLPIQSPIFAFQYLPIIIPFTVIFGLLYYCEISSWIFINIGWLFDVTVKTTAIESVVTVFCFFLGHAKSMMLVQNHLRLLTPCEYTTVLAAAFVTTGICNGEDPKNFLTESEMDHIILAQFLTMPAVFTFSKLIYPETRVTVSRFSDINIYSDISISNITPMNVIMCAVKSAAFAMTYICIIGGNIIAFVAGLQFICDILKLPGYFVGMDYITVEWLLAPPYVPFIYMTGVSWSESEIIARCVATRTLWGSGSALRKMVELKDDLSIRAEIIALYICGGSVGIVTVGPYLGAMAYICPSEITTLARVIPFAYLSATMATLSTAYIAGSIIL